MSREEIHEVVTEIIGPLEDEGYDPILVQKVIDRVNTLNRGAFGSKDQIKQEVWSEFKDEWYQAYRDRFLTRNSRQDCSTSNKSKDCEGLVAVCYKQNAPVTPEIVAQRTAYIAGANAYTNGPGGPAQKMSTTGPLRRTASSLAQQERERHPEKYQGLVVGHVPDTQWTGPPPGNPASIQPWLPMDEGLNGAIGGQGNGYPNGYRALAFVPGDYDSANRCSPSLGFPSPGLNTPPTYLGN